MGGINQSIEQQEARRLGKDQMFHAVIEGEIQFFKVLKHLVQVLRSGMYEAG